MPVAVSLLRAVNVAGHQKISMSALREAYTELGLSDVNSYVQSGNLVFRARSLRGLDDTIADGIEARFGFRTEVMVRSLEELGALVEANPFADRRGLEPAKLLVLFLAARPTKQAVAELEQLVSAPEQLGGVRDREVYLYYPNGMGRSKLTTAKLEKALGVRSTGRNWNTVTKLLALAESIGSS